MSNNNHVSGSVVPIGRYYIYISIYIYTRDVCFVLWEKYCTKWLGTSGHCLSIRKVGEDSICFTNRYTFFSKKDHLWVCDACVGKAIWPPLYVIACVFLGVRLTVGVFLGVSLGYRYLTTLLAAGCRASFTNQTHIHAVCFNIFVLCKNVLFTEIRVFTGL